jgi:hypothetical protein
VARRGRLPTSIPFGFPPRSFVARGTEAGTRARLMPSTSPTCFFGRLLLLAFLPAVDLAAVDDFVLLRVLTKTHLLLEALRRASNVPFSIQALYREP